MMYAAEECYSDKITSGPLVEELIPECPNCGSPDGTPVYWDNGICAQTGYHDAGEGCTKCIPGGER